MPMKNQVLIAAFVVIVLVGVAVNLQYLKAIILQADRRKVVHDDRPKLQDEVMSILRHKQPPHPAKPNPTPFSKVKGKITPLTAELPVVAKKAPAGKRKKHVVGKDHKVAGLNCEKYGGPSTEAASEMVYWRDIPTDSEFVSPFAKYGPSKKYLTFEPDEGGWNNIRMSMETATVLALAMGRTLVLPYEQNMYLLRNDKKGGNRFTFKDFFHFESIASEHKSVEVISMEEFIHQEAMTGHLRDRNGKVTFPPGNQTVWEGHGRMGKPFYHWLRNATASPIWFFDNCVVAFGKESGPENAAKVKTWRKTLPGDKKSHAAEYVNKPTPVDADTHHRLLETLGERREICVYGDHFQNEKVIHFMGDNASGARLLTHFYTYLFFENWKHDLWTKRFVRDHLRYIDEIQCAAARVVEAVRAKARQNGDPSGTFDTFHIRRGDFQYKTTRIEADQILKNVGDLLVENSTIFIATDERNKTFFDPFRQRYHVYFLDDFAHLVTDLNKNYYGMLDQRIASRGRTFIGAYFSTFTGYINRMRGYHSQKEKLPGWELGKIQSYFYAPIRVREALVKYRSIEKPYWAREFPIGWRDIDHDMTPENFADASR